MKLLRERIRIKVKMADNKNPSKRMNQTVCRMAIFIIWLMILTPVYTANALEVQFNPDADITVTDLSAKIVWKTDELSKGTVFYGLDGQVTSHEENNTQGKEHSVEIKGISASTRFLFYILAKNSTSEVRNPEEGLFHEFTTDAPRDHTVPKAVKSLAAPTINKDSVTITWEKDPADTDVDHYVVSRGSEVLSDNVKEETYTDTGLSFSTEYVYKVIAVDTSANPSQVAALKVTTRDENYQPVTISDFKADVFGTSVFLSWKTNIAAHTKVKFGQSQALLDQKKELPEMVTDHNMTLADLPANSDMTLMAESCDASGNCGSSEQSSFKTTEKIELMLVVDGLDCNPQTASFSNTNRIDVKGKASPGADVKAFVNGKMLRYKRITSTAEFNFAGLDLDPSKAENEIKITASDHISPDKECFEKFLLDYFSPEVVFSNETENLKLTMENNVRLSGNLTDEHKVTLYISSRSVDDTISPSKPLNLVNTSISANAVTIKWDAPASNDTDTYKYIIYRSDVLDGPIATAEPTVTTFNDDKVSTSTSYTYTVTAIDKAGNEGEKSSPLTITTLPGGSVAQPLVKIASPDPTTVLTKEFNTNNNTIEFSETVSNLVEGKNKITMKFVDQAGNIFEKDFEIIKDSEPPKIISPTAAEIQSLYSPAHTSEIKIAGQINKPAGEVWIWVNPTAVSGSATQASVDVSAFASTYGEPVMKVPVGEEGTFEADLELSTAVGAYAGASVSSTAGQGSVSITQSSSAGVGVTSASGRQNKIVMIAVDNYGRKSVPVEGNIEYQSCGENFYWNIKLTPGGSILNPRELIEGVAAYGFGFELEWVGGGDKTKAKPAGVPIVRKATVSATERSKFDFDWIGEPTVLCNRNNCTKGFIMINFLKQEPAGKTILEQEKNISNHRKKECKVAGCIKLLLEMQIESDPAPIVSQYSVGTNSMPVNMPIMGTQKQCLWVTVMTDDRLDIGAKEWVKDVLNASLKVINVTLDTINKVQPIIDYAAKFSAIVCGVSTLATMVTESTAAYQCRWNGAVSKLSEGGFKGLKEMITEFAKGKIEKIAKMDDGKNAEKSACNVEFDTRTAKNKDEEEAIKAANNACQQCASAIDSSRTVKDKWHLFCDRVMCPSVPSLQHYILSKYKSGKKVTWKAPPQTGNAQVTASDDTKYDNVIAYQPGNWKMVQKTDLSDYMSDCAYADLGRDSLESMFKFYTEGSKEEQEKCEKGHVPQPSCCPFEYMQEWKWGMMFGDEIKQSYCLANPEDNINCGFGAKVVNGVTGICQPQSSTPRATFVVLNDLKWAENQPGVSSSERVNDQVVYLVDVDEKGNPNKVVRGFYQKSEVAEMKGPIEESGRVEVSTASFFMPDPQSNPEETTTWFPKLDNTDLRNDEIKNGSIEKFNSDIKAQIESGRIVARSGAKEDITRKLANKETSQDWYRQVSGLMGDPGRQYLAQPAGSFIQSIITLCLTSLNQWLNHLKNILLMLQQCFQTIIITGDGSAGQCRAIMSQYICDVLKEAISCVARRLGGSATGRVGVGGITGVFSAMADGSRSVMAAAQSRYGDNNILSNTFSAENLMWDTCIWMFTGEWPVDWNQLLQSAVTLPINSTGNIVPATRSYRVYDPNTGFATYVYRIGYFISAGSNMHYDIKLVCSNNDATCTTLSDGTRSCDCSTPGRALSDYATKYQVGTTGVELPIPRHQSGNCPEGGDLTQGQFCTDEIIFVAQGQPLRYDKVVIDYRPTQAAMGTGGYSGGLGVGTGVGTGGTGIGGNMASPQALTGRFDATIQEINAPPVGLCSFDITKMAFRCGIEIPQMGYARFVSSKLIKEGGKPYGVGDSEIAKVTIEQVLPKDAPSCGSQDCAFTKYLVIKDIKNQNGGIVYPRGVYGNLAGERLNENKIHELTVFSTSDFVQHTMKYTPFVITREMFSVTSSADRSISTRGMLANYLMSAVEPVNIRPPTVMQVKYLSQSKKVVAAIGVLQPQSTTGPEKSYDFSQDERPCQKSDTQQGKFAEMFCGYDTESSQGTGFKFILDLNRLLNLKNDSLMEINYAEPTKSTSSQVCPQEPIPWTMSLEIRDADSIGNGAGYQPGSIASRDPETNAEQKLPPITFQVVCRDTESRSALNTSSIIDLKGRTAYLKEENTETNKIFDMWIQNNSISSGETVKIGNFIWTYETDPAQMRREFSIEISVDASNPILFIDISRLDTRISEDSEFIVDGINVKESCSNGNKPCISRVNDRLVKLELMQSQSMKIIFTKLTPILKEEGNIEFAQQIPDCGLTVNSRGFDFGCAPDPASSNEKTDIPASQAVASTKSKWGICKEKKGNTAARFCISEAECSKGTIESDASSCDSGLVCCRPEGLAKGEVCGPKLGLAGNPTCKTGCDDDKSYAKGTSGCSGSLTCCYEKVECVKENPRNVIIDELTWTRQGASQENTVVSGIKVGDEIKDCTKATGTNFAICLPGFSDNPSSVWYGKCINLVNSKASLKRYCPWMSSKTCTSFKDEVVSGVSIRPNKAAFYEKCVSEDTTMPEVLVKPVCTCHRDKAIGKAMTDECRKLLGEA